MHFFVDNTCDLVHNTYKLVDTIKLLVHNTYKLVYNTFHIVDISKLIFVRSGTHMRRDAGTPTHTNNLFKRVWQHWHAQNLSHRVS